MGITEVELIEDVVIPEDVENEIKKFLTQGVDVSKFVSRRNSSASDGSDCRQIDTERSEDVEKWEGLWSEKDHPTTEENPWKWTTHCDVFTYSDCEFLLLIFAQRFVLLGRSPDGKRFTTLTKVKVENTEANITCGCLFGLSTPRRANQLDSLIISIGTQDGYVHFFTEKGTLLFFERFSNSEVVTGISFDEVKLTQAFIVTLQRTFFFIHPDSLNSTILLARNMIARKEKTAEEISEEIEIRMEHFSMENEGEITKVVYTGVHQPSTIDLYNKAAFDSFYARVERPILPTFTTFAVTTDSAFLHFLWHDNETGERLWNEAVKIGKSLMPSFGIRKFLGISQKANRKTPLMEAMKPLATRCSLLDERIAERMEKSPNGRYLAIADRLARVVLVDVGRRQIVRVWKGYRDAEIAWTTTVYERKVALFLTIHVPRQDRIEVWTVPGMKLVHSQQVADGFLAPGGETNLLCGAHRQHVPFTAFFFDENFKKIVVPFQLVLGTGTTDDQHDLVLMRKIESQSDPKMFLQIFDKLKLEDSKRKAFQTVLGAMETFEQAEELMEEIEKSKHKNSIKAQMESVEKALKMRRKLMKDRKKTDSDDNFYELSDVAEKILFIHLGIPNEEVKIAPLSLQKWLNMICWTGKTSIENCDDTDLKSLGAMIFEQFFDENQDIFVPDFLDDLEGLNIEKKDLLKIFCLTFSAVPHVAKDVFARSVKFIQELSKSDEDMVLLVENYSLNSVEISRAILLIVGAWCARSSQKKTNLPSKSVEELKEKLDELAVNPEPSVWGNDDEWDTVTPELEHLDGLLQSMHAVGLLYNLTRNRPERMTQVVVHADSFFREQLAVWLARRNSDKAEVRQFMEDAETGPIVDWPTDEQSIMSRIRQLLPRSLGLDELLADTAWQNMVMWFRDKDGQFQNFELAVEHLESITCKKLQHGVTRLVWDKFIATDFRAICQFVEKTGRAPRERESRKEVGFSEVRITTFIETCRRMLQILMNAVRDPPEGERPPIDDVIEEAQLYIRHRLERGVSLRSREDSLVSIAFKQSLVNYQLVLHHFHLCVALSLQLSVGIKQHLLSAVFCTAGRRAFFVPFDSHPVIPLENVNDSVMEKRYGFLSKVAEEGSSEDRLEAKNLAAEWALTTNSISLMQAVADLRAGEDSKALQELTVVERNEHAAIALARIIAARIVSLATSQGTILAATHSKYLCDLAGDETARVELGSHFDTWQASVESLGKIARSFAVDSRSAKPFVRLNDIAQQYWAVRWID